MTAEREEELSYFPALLVLVSGETLGQVVDIVRKHVLTKDIVAAKVPR